jgi:ribosomal protein L17
MPLTDQLTDVAQFLFDLFTTNKAALGIQDVWWGDQSKLPRTPALCVEPATKTRVLNGAPRRTSLTLNVSLLLFTSKIQDVQNNRKAVDELAESCEALVHLNPQMDGLVVHSLVDTFESGYATRSGTLYRATRLNVAATSQAMLPFSA